MDRLKLSDNIIRLRHERKITQEELADFLGVTKASVSKWENAQSTPDLMLLLQLSAYFDITIDELIGYEAQLSQKQIRRFYAELVKDFEEHPFHEAIERTRTLAHRYYSCHPFLLQLSVLYLNHYMLAESKEEQEQILEEAISWCEHIMENCDDVGVCGDALVLKACISLQMGRTAETIDMLESTSQPARLAGQGGAILVQAFKAVGEYERARSYIQAREYVDLLNLLGDAVISLDLYQDDLERCKKTIHRLRNLMESYQLEQLHPNAAAQFHYQTAVVFALNEEEEDALQALHLFKRCVDRLLRAEKLVLHGDEYFDQLDAWIETLPLGDMAPRNKKFIIQSIQTAFCHPAFEGMKENPDFQMMLHYFEEH